MALSLVISIAALLFAAVFKALAESCAHGKSKFSTRDFDFWDSDGWIRKWAKAELKGTSAVMPAAPDTWYYRFFKLKYKERFLGSATIFVAFTDAYHASFSIMTTLVVIAVSIWTPWPFWFFLFVRIAWGIAFSIGYKVLSR